MSIHMYFDETPPHFADDMERYAFEGSASVEARIRSTARADAEVGRTVVTINCDSEADAKNVLAHCVRMEIKGAQINELEVDQRICDYCSSVVPKKKRHVVQFNLPMLSQDRFEELKKKEKAYRTRLLNAPPRYVNAAPRYGMLTASAAGESYVAFNRAETDAKTDAKTDV